MVRDFLACKNKRERKAARLRKTLLTGGFGCEERREASKETRERERERGCGFGGTDVLFKKKKQTNNKQRKVK